MTLDLHKPVFLSLLFLLIFIYYIIFFKKSTNKNINNFLFTSSFIFYILCVIKLTILPMRITPLEGFNFDLSYCYQIIPLKTISQVIKYNTWKMQLIGNILLLLPLPIFIKILSRKDFTIFKLFSICLLVSISIEATQFIIDLITKFPNKIADIDDIILNSIGSLIGVLLADIYNKKIKCKLNRL